MWRNKRQNRVLRCVGRAMIFLGAVCFILLICFEAAVRPSLEKLLSYKCRITAEKLICNAVFGNLSGELESCGDLVSFTFNENGDIAALKTNQSKINSLKALINETVNSSISEIENERVSISLGTLTGISYLYGMGSELQFRLEPRGKAETRLISNFKSAGINQTIHSITLEVAVELSPMLPGFNEEIEVVSDFIIAQTVLVGRVPESYSNIILDEEYYSELADFDL